MTWLATKTLGLKNGLWLALGLTVAIGAAIFLKAADNAVEDALDTAKEAGASEAVTKGHRTTLKQIGAANEAGNQVRDDRGNAQFDECLRSATEATRDNCERFRNEPLPGDEGDSPVSGP